MSEAADVLTCVFVAAVLAPLGRWGYRNAATLLPAALPEQERDRRQQVLRRGAVTAQAVAVLFVFAGLLRMLA
ncbi:MAG: hypothetical protein GEV04_08460 [Actinophytocola sp.]|nr:hypothetical protein [Actinophytocola sp.]